MYKYYSTQRPIGPGTVPQPEGNPPLEVINYDERLFSLWTAAAGAETGTELSAASIQLDRAQARRLRELLDEFLSQAEPDT